MDGGETSDGRNINWDMLNNNVERAISVIKSGCVLQKSCIETTGIHASSLPSCKIAFSRLPQQMEGGISVAISDRNVNYSGIETEITQTFDGIHSHREMTVCDAIPTLNNEAMMHPDIRHRHDECDEEGSSVLADAVSNPPSTLLSLLDDVAAVLDSKESDFDVLPTESEVKLESVGVAVDKCCASVSKSVPSNPEDKTLAIAFDEFINQLDEVGQSVRKCVEFGGKFGIDEDVSSIDDNTSSSIKEVMNVRTIDPRELSFESSSAQTPICSGLTPPPPYPVRDAPPSYDDLYTSFSDRAQISSTPMKRTDNKFVPNVCNLLVKCDDKPPIRKSKSSATVTRSRDLAYIREYLSRERSSVQNKYQHHSDSTEDTRTISGGKNIISNLQDAQKLDRRSASKKDQIRDISAKSARSHVCSPAKRFQRQIPLEKVSSEIRSCKVTLSKLTLRDMRRIVWVQKLRLPSYVVKLITASESVQGSSSMLHKNITDNSKLPSKSRIRFAPRTREILKSIAASSVGSKIGNWIGVGSDERKTVNETGRRHRPPAAAEVTPLVNEVRKGGVQSKDVCTPKFKGGVRSKVVCVPQFKGGVRSKVVCKPQIKGGVRSKVVVCKPQFIKCDISAYAPPKEVEKQESLIVRVETAGDNNRSVKCVSDNHDVASYSWSVTSDDRPDFQPITRQTISKRAPIDFDALSEGEIISSCSGSDRNDFCYLSVVSDTPWTSPFDSPAHRRSAVSKSRPPKSVSVQVDDFSDGEIVSTWSEADGSDVASAKCGSEGSSLNQIPIVVSGSDRSASRSSTYEGCVEDIADITDRNHVSSYRDSDAYDTDSDYVIVDSDGGGDDRDPKRASSTASSPTRVSKSKSASPNNELVRFVSDDPLENLDNGAPEWAHLRNLSTDHERYKYVRERWRNDEVPDPHHNLSYAGFLRQRVRRYISRVSRSDDSKKLLTRRGLKRAHSDGNINFNNLIVVCSDRTTPCTFAYTERVNELNRCRTDLRSLLSSISDHKEKKPKPSRSSRFSGQDEVRHAICREKNIIEGRQHRLEAAEEETLRFFKFYANLAEGDESKNAVFLDEEQRAEVEAVQRSFNMADLVYGRCHDEDL